MGDGGWQRRDRGGNVVSEARESSDRCGAQRAGDVEAGVRATKRSRLSGLSTTATARHGVAASSARRTISPTTTSILRIGWASLAIRSAFNVATSASQTTAASVVVARPTVGRRARAAFLHEDLLSIDRKRVGSNGSVVASGSGELDEGAALGV